MRLVGALLLSVAMQTPVELADCNSSSIIFMARPAQALPDIIIRFYRPLRVEGRSNGRVIAEFEDVERTNEVLRDVIARPNLAEQFSSIECAPRVWQ